MDLPPPVFDDLQGAKEWCDLMYRWLTFPGNLHPQYLELQELSQIEVPADGRGRIYLADAGEGLSQFLIVFPTGDPIRMAKEATGVVESTDELEEGTTNLFFTEDRAIAAVQDQWPYLLQADAEGNLDLDGYLTTNVISTASVSDPPTEAELDSVVGSVSDGFQALLWDSTNSKMYFIAYDGINLDWYYVLLTKAV